MQYAQREQTQKKKTGFLMSSMVRSLNKMNETDETETTCKGIRRKSLFFLTMFFADVAAACLPLIRFEGASVSMEE